MKVSANGTKMWERIIQGTGGAEIYDIEQTPDNGFILGGVSNQRAGGDQTEDSSGGDYWIVKLNADLSIAWNNVLNTLFYDNGRGQNTFTDLTQTPDGGYAVLGYSSEPGLGDKSEDAHNESADFWLVKLNASGTQVWDKVIGGAGNEFDGSIASTSDGGLIIAGRSSSDISFDKTENKKSNSDFWIVKLAPEYVTTTPTTMRINSGGPEFTTATKKTFVSDKYYSGIDRTSSIPSGDILNTTNDVLYRSGRSSPSFSYNIPVVNGQVNVTLHFAEVYFGAPGKKGGTGSRRFHVNMEGSRKLTNYDIFVAAGGALRANQVTFPVMVTDGVLNIDFLTGAADQPRVCAIEVVPVSVTLTPVADAYVRGGSYSVTNFGLTGSLEVKSLSTDPAVNRAFYLKFQLPAQTPVVSAKLRVYGRNHENTKPISLHAYGVNTDTWAESAINQSNAPAASTASLGFAAVNNVYQYYEIDVTSYVRARQQAGEALVSLLLNDPNSRNTRLIFNSREAASNPPQLVIQTTNPGARFGLEEVFSEAAEKQPSTVYPNPVKDQFTVSLSPEHGGQISFEMINAAGKSRSVPAPRNIKPGENTELNIAGQSFNTGIYSLKVKSDAFTEVIRILIAE
ncbi:CBM96 family carbohydrate-binding protein [Dyadobacter sandarakinus]|uniref:DNRLRE domain-containing protein n=1 Tax=Dyadobacter sandarakinus TaxID=2747268 RepID=A0ABX7I8F7_9BACT|nr:DNRLRE domain-containing protein [Dyadobacter sandarakinus]QRR01458.1 DNRLRE domain-containing protein [Dyadobacter sandarakinus]